MHTHTHPSPPHTHTPHTYTQFEEEKGPVTTGATTSGNQGKNGHPLLLRQKGIWHNECVYRWCEYVCV